MKQIEFDLRFECGHTAKIPLIHSQDHANCFVCHPELRDQVSPGMCSACVVDEYERKRNEEK